MQCTRRGFLKLTGAGVACLSLGRMGVNLAEAKAYSMKLKTEGAKEILTVCPFCSVSCNIIASVRDGKLISTEGDPDFPVNEGALCAKGAALTSMSNNHHRLLKPKYRAPYSDTWEEKDWGWMLETIARRVKDTRDRDMILKNAKGHTVNRVESLFHMGTSHASNEECSVIHQAIRGLGIVHFDHQARVCHSSTVSSLAESFGRGAMTNHWIDIQNADVILIMGSNAAEHHPISFKWVLRAKDKGAVVMHVDPKFSRTSARCDFHVPLRSGTDIAFMGGLINHVLEHEKYFREYVVNYTNAALIVGKDFAFNDGLFSGYDPKTRSYDRSKWAFEEDSKGLIKRDDTLKHPRCVFNLLRKHYARYTVEDVSSVTGVPREKLLKVYENFASSGTATRAGSILYALGWTQHTVGVQNIRTAGILQLLLGNIGRSGGGINALRGEPNVQGSTDIALLYHVVPGYMPMPISDWQSYDEYNKVNTPAAKSAKSVNWWQHKPKYFTSLLKAWYGDYATKENGYCYDLLPKLDKGADHSYLFMFDRMYKQQLKGGFIVGVNPANSLPNTKKIRKALDTLDWMVVMDLHHSETSENWRRKGTDPKSVKTEVFLLPSAHRVEKPGTVTNSGRWVVWHNQCVKPMGEARNFGDFFVPMVNEVRKLYKAEGGTLPEPILKLNWPEVYDTEEWTKRINGYFWRDTVVNGKKYRKGQLVPSFTALKDDGSTSSLCWVYTGSYTEEFGNLSKRRDPSQTPLQAKIGLYPNWSWSWPANRRILYNRASVDVNGKPFDPERIVIMWDGKQWVGDIPDGGAPPLATAKGTLPFIMAPAGMGQLYGPGRMDGPFAEHYEPAETPIASHPFSGQLSSPVYKFVSSDMDVLAKPADPRFPVVLTTYSLTEHWCGGGETRNVPNLLEAEPQLYVEMSHELAKEKGIANGDGVILESARGQVEAIAMVTVRMRPLTVQGKTVHLVGMPFCFGWTTPGCGDSTNRLTPSVGDPNTTIPETKACCVNIRKAGKLNELAR